MPVSTIHTIALLGTEIGTLAGYNIDSNHPLGQHGLMDNFTKLTKGQNRFIMGYQIF